MDAKSKLESYRTREADRVRSYAKSAGMSLPGKYASGGAVKGRGAKTNITIVIGKDDKAAAPPMPMPKPPPVVMPPPAPPPGGLAGGAPPPGGPMGGMPGGMPGMKKGGAVKATAKPMTAGAGSAEGRLEKAASESKKEGRKRA